MQFLTCGHLHKNIQSLFNGASAVSAFKVTLISLTALAGVPQRAFGGIAQRNISFSSEACLHLGGVLT